MLARGDEPVDDLDHRRQTRVADDEAVPAPPVVAFWLACLPLAVHDSVHLIESEHGSGPAIAVIADDPHVHIADLVEVLSRTGHEADLVSVTPDPVKGAVPHARSVALCRTPPHEPSQTAHQYTTLLLVLFRLRLMHPEITVVWADSAYAGQLVDWAWDFLHLTVRTVSRPKDVTGFVVLPRRWVAERSPGWITHARRWPGTMSGWPSTARL